MHLVIVTDELATDMSASGGLGAFTANLARIFQGNGHKVTVVLSTTKAEKPVFDAKISLRNIYVEKSIWESFAHIAGALSNVEKREDKDELRKFMVNVYKSEQVERVIEEINKKEKIDIIHACNLSALPFSLHHDIPYVVRISSIRALKENAEFPEGCREYDEGTLSVRIRLENAAIRKAKYVVAPSNLLAAFLKEQMGVAATVIESPFLLEEGGWDYTVYDSLAKGKRYIIHYGKLGYLKGTHIVAGIVGDILRRYPDISILLVGQDSEMLDEDGEKIAAHELVKKCAGEYSDRVLFAGRLVRKQLYPLIQNAELCLLPSRIDNLPNACIEAMAVGTTVVGTDGASFEQLIDDRASGFLCKRDDKDSFLQAVKEALEMEADARKKMVRKASERVRQLAPDVIYQKYLAFYQRVIREWPYGPDGEGI